MKEKKDYLKIVYNEKDRPFTEYPNKLTKYIFDNFNLKVKQNILDVGCGRGEFLNGFMQCGMKPYGIDQSNAAKKKYKKINFKFCDLENKKIPYHDDFFDVIFSKSVIEHFHYPEKLFQEMNRVLKKNGQIITLTPDWEINYKTFYEDYTHRTPFSETSLRDIHLINGFKEVKIFKFKQLPILWNKSLIFNILSELTRILVPSCFKKFKWVKFSKEIILLSVAIK